MTLGKHTVQSVVHLQCLFRYPNDPITKTASAFAVPLQSHFPGGSGPGGSGPGGSGPGGSEPGASSSSQGEPRGVVRP